MNTITSLLILYNGRIYTQDPQQPHATAVAIRDNRIVAVGSDDEVKALPGPVAERVDLNGRGVTPGLVDAHVHFQHYALFRRRLDLDGVATLDEALQRIAGYAENSAPDQWLLGRGWNQAGWPGGAFPTAADLDRVVPQAPVYLNHKSGHAAWANSRALRIARIDERTADPPGGQIQRDESGRPTGILFEEAADLVRRHVPRPTEAELVAAMRAAQEHCWSVGLTGIHDFDGRACFQALQRLHQNGELGLRVVKNIPAYRFEHAIGLGLRTGFGDDWLRIGGVKIFADGALGPRTAAMLDPYEAEPDNRGISVTDKEEMMAIASQAGQNGLNVTVHAIGDRANHDVLDVYEVLRREERERSFSQDLPLRHRIEHVQLLHPDDLDRLARLDIIASMQPIHATSDMEMADRHWGERARYSYAWRSLRDTGALLVFGSDAPVEPIEPLLGIYAAVSRRRADGAPGPDGWYPEQRLTLAETIHAFTTAAAVTAGQETRLGSISPGKLADLTIFDQDLFSLPADELPAVTIAGTMVDGRFCFRALNG
jgi:predicted amidohydrolase YtcJ